MAYSIVWLVYAVILLVLGIALSRSLLRYASLAVLIVTVLKVFLIDMAGLTGLYRVGSFLGLGLSLIGIGYIYQRFVFPRPALGEAGREIAILPRFRGRIIAASVMVVVAAATALCGT